MMNKQALANRLLVTVVIFSLMYLVLAASFLTLFYFERASLNVRDMEEKLVLTVSNSASIALYVDNPEIADEVMSSLLLHDEFNGVKLKGIDGIEFSLSKLTSNREQWQNLERFPLVSPVKDEVIGHLILDVNQEYLDSVTQEKVFIQLVMLISQLLMLLIVTAFAVRKVIGFPLQKLAENLSKVEPGKDELLPYNNENRDNEIGLVTASVNRFVEASHQAIETERNLRATIERMERHYRHIFETTQVGILVLDKNGHLIHSNPTLFGRLIKESFELTAILETQPFFEHVFQNPELAWQMSEQTISSGDMASGDLRINKRYSADQWVHLLLSAHKDEHSGEWLIEGIMYDITVRVQKERDTLLLALEDNLTGLKNRRGCERFVATLASQKKAAYIATMMLDLDGFKDVNDTHGHAAGDEVLCTIARRLKKVARGGQDVIGRIGGDELLVILALEQINPDVLAGIAEQIVEICARPIELPSRSTVRIGGSVGVAYAGVNDIEFDALLQQADEAMYQVKENGKNGYAFYNPELRRA
ncbi:hypothetical protein TUMSATVNIG1_32180 [Vibrio nigripulchritudo]|uniref:GGDEF domain and PAS/PAC domain protein n=1 Tax=Vibrio nigripulchritudo SOn1 TaxID=1238450 RepID=A0AAV2VXI1_9VIBR|nr:MULTISPECIES: sensor domain-containing diguanylate cyclase [Vibrio]KJY66764.1 hypothetical protein TW74_27620 [Vibrio nigripulchritudo]UAB70739.1 diguanylate cyclase [Vibrio sp. SCSIO 43132]CCO49218.1 putative GGDEF domain and PAS/PAC domain protein [Vibrio nigripulchritudo SOn1]BCL71252.1 hypothetical protein VNTUMSATTG_31890 [Vibrio nigripulchritudo]BDU32609.1 hypothetical protein TUMSATVNIG1_32180 [Vibrio nigripulchritudo]